MPGYEDRASILQQGAGDMIKLVCERSTPEQWAEWLRAPLEHAAGTADYEMVKNLLKAGADGSAGWKGCHGKTLLHAAAEGGDGQVVTSLIRAGAGGDMDARTPDAAGRTPLHLAILGGKEAAAQALILAGADVNVRDALVNAPLHLAIRGRHTGTAGQLLIRGADHDVKDSSGRTPIHLAAEFGLDEIALALVQAGANLNSRSSGWGFGTAMSGKTPLQMAVQADHVSTVELLLAGGADANRKTFYGTTALHTAAEFDRKAFIPALVEAGANIDERSISGWSPLHKAVDYGSCASVRALLRLGANVNSKTNDGLTPLHAAVLQGNADVADLLLRWGADETIVNNTGRTPHRTVPDIADADDDDRPRLERLTKLLVHAPQDRAWRRRGLMVMCRAHPDRVRLVVEIHETSAEAVGQQPLRRPSRRARRAEVKVKVQVGHTRGAARGGGAGSGDGAVNGFDGVAAWLMAVADEEVFRRIVVFL